ncbi:MAG: Asp-tRNA(Asn)/Glu-tRNA(Gln) amidotransferase subunit GatA, partial [Chloroflexota bacterium]|nr:Asp-tRNA(Asn)/Glu-tRNA(Gln) amidotransferase subunit GatA [Chloroflexota bacterium]
MSLHTLTIHEAARRLRASETSSVELTQAALDRIQQVDDRVRAFMTVTSELALEQARAADQRLASGGEASPLLGVPMALKDVLVTEGVRTTCSSKILENYLPVYDGTVVSRLRQAGAVFLGKT